MVVVLNCIDSLFSNIAYCGRLPRWGDFRRESLHNMSNIEKCLTASNSHEAKYKNHICHTILNKARLKSAATVTKSPFFLNLVKDLLRESENWLLVHFRLFQGSLFNRQLCFAFFFQTRSLQRLRVCVNFTRHCQPFKSFWTNEAEITVSRFLFDYLFLDV